VNRLSLAVLLALLGAGCFGGGAPGSVGRSDGETRADGPVPSGCYRGRLMGEGVTCQAMRTDAGELITLGGPRCGFATGDRVCVFGAKPRDQFYRRGVTMVIREVSDTCADIR